jgi:hypothetical protein
MIRLYLFVEGQTEQTFANLVLTEHLALLGVYLQPPILVAHARRKGKAHRGGVLKYRPLKDDIGRFLKQEKSDTVRFTTMIDLYRLPHDFPDYDDAAKFKSDPIRRVEHLENAFRQDMIDPRFLPYIQLHEYESLLFVDPNEFAFYYSNCGKPIDSLVKISRDFTSPELIDDGPTTAPSKRIIQLLPQYECDKVRVGSGVAKSQENWP